MLTKTTLQKIWDRSNTNFGKFVLCAAVNLPAVVQAQECQLQQTIKSTSTAVITDIQNITKDVMPWGENGTKCMVTLDGLYNGQWRTAFGEYTWFGKKPVEEICSVAIGLAKKNLLDSVNSSTIKTDSTIFCRDTPKPTPANIKVGTIVEDMTQLRIHPFFIKTFKYKGSNCRWFVEVGWNGRDLQDMNGIVCLTSNRQWIVVDKF